MDLNALKASLLSLQQQRHAYGHAMSCLQVDGETAAPEGASAARGQTMAFLSQKSYELFVNDDTRALLAGLLEARDELDAETLRQAELLQEELDEMTRIPMEEYIAYTQLINDAGSAWVKAKNDNDYTLFEPYLAKIIEYTRRFAAYRNPDLPAYDVLLDSYEKGMNTAILDEFFSKLRGELVPLLAQISRQQPRPAFVDAPCDLNLQREWSKKLMNVMGLDPQRCAIAETEHPFTAGMNRWDVRITTHYYPSAVLSSMYSVIHEGGHALYELGFDEKYHCTVLSDAPSMGMHESQSRFYENLVGRSLPFLTHLLPAMKEAFPGLVDDVDAQTLYRAVNYVEPSLIRTEADQVTYPLHIMVRYELEKQLIAGTLSTKDLPEAWNALYKEYLGIDVPSDTLGVLQDTHWSGGMFGYFPTYALGSAYASQLLHAMKQELDMDSLLAEGDLAPITAWLGEHIHRHGNRYAPADLLSNAVGGKFDASYYVAHLKNIIHSLTE